ncbi:MAG TPA: protein-disulfide reductase DsbD family protein [Saprospiraceae bacterium]|nr:protein-disulfide reductase DsbD family protein [Saprospiraceae bacterium]
MRKLNIFWTFFFALLSFSIHAQIYDPVKWTSSFKQIGDDEYELTWTAKIDNGWSIYSQYIDPNVGPNPTSVVFDNKKAIELIGKNVEGGHIKTVYDEIWEAKITKFTETAILKQKIKVLDDSKPISGYVNYQTCDDTKCLPPADFEFSFKVKNKKKDQSAETGVGAVDSKGEASVEVLAGAPNQDDNKEMIQPVSWSATVKKESITKTTIIFNASIEKGYKIYSKDIKGDGPIPTSITLDKNSKGNITGIKEQSTGAKTAFDPYFKINVTTLSKTASFDVSLDGLEAGKPVSGTIDYMACDDSKCSPFLAYWKTDANLENVVISFEPFPEDAGPAISGSEAGFFPINNIDLNNPLSTCSADSEANVKESTGLFTIFLLGFIGGLIALLTPCVFPMIPLTVSFFTKSNKDKKKGITNAFLYGFFIFLIYILLSVPFHLLDSINPNILNDISTNAWLNVAFFLIFMVFAFSFFGYYEITLPSSLSNKVSSAEGVGGVIGIFFMALTLALVSFSCTGPILGSLLAGTLSSNGGAWNLTAGMGGFGIALALPFALFAAFPSWMNTIPKSGGWLNTVKVVLGFIEVALAFKFLSNADLVKHWGLLKIEPFLLIWILVALGLFAYLMGWIRFPHDSKLKKLSPTRVVLALISLVFAIYLATGFIYNKETKTFTSLSLLSGLAPPVGYSILYPNDCPNNLNCFHDLEEGLAYAKSRNLPVFLDFTGYACVNCRNMEEHVWPTNKVKNLLTNEFVVISLYVDDKTPLPEDQQVTLTYKNGGTKRIKTVGDKWNFFQTDNFNNNSQPLYALITNTGKLLNTPVGYTPDPEQYATFLQCGIDAFKASEGKETIGSR